MPGAVRPAASPRAAGAQEKRRLALASLRPRLTGPHDDVRWAVDPDGVIGRSLVMGADRSQSFPLTLGEPRRLVGRVAMFPHDWRDGVGAIRARITTVDRRGRSHTVWTTTLRAGDRGRANGATIDCVLSADACELTLALDPVRIRSRAVARALWVEPALVLDTPEVDSPRRAAPPAPAAADGADGALVSVLVPVHDPPVQMLEDAIASVRRQTFDGWQLCLVDDGSSDPAVIESLRAHASADARINLTRHETALGISAATNTALAAATGRYVATLDHDDTLTDDALEQVAAAVAADPTLDMLYSDEDTVDDDGRAISVHLKPAWSPDTMRTNGYTCHLGVYRRELVSAIGAFRSEFNGSQDIDMILRLVERTDRIAHIPRVLYHWRAHANSTAAAPESKPYAYVAARNAIADHVRRTRLPARVEFAPPGLYRLVHEVDPGLSVDLVLALHSADGLTQAAASWTAQPHPTWHAVLAAPADLHPALHDALATATVTPDRYTLLTTTPGLTPAAALAHAAHHATAEHLVLIQSPAAGLTHDWLTRLLGYSQQPGIGAAGPVVLAPDGRIQHAGIALPDGIPLHLLHGTRSSMDRFFGYGTSVYNLSAVSGILATPRALHDQLDGLHPDRHELTLIDYCLRAATTDHRTVIVPDARLTTTGPDPTTNDIPTIQALRAARAGVADRYYNAGYRSDRGDFVLASYG